MAKADEGTFSKANRLHTQFARHRPITDTEFLWLREVGHRDLVCRTEVIRCTHRSAEGLLYSKIPLKALRFMASLNHGCAEFALAELSRRGTQVTPSKVVVTHHAIDQFSKRKLSKWLNDEETGMLAGVGLASWLEMQAQHAFDDGVMDDTGSRYMRDGMMFGISVDNDYIKLTTVI